MTARSARRSCALLLGLMLGGCGAGIPTPVNSSGRPPPVQPSALEQGILEGINQQRSRAGLPPLIAQPAMSAVARQYAQDMAAGRSEFSHDGAQRRLATIVEGWTPLIVFGENLAYHSNATGLAVRIVDSWMASPGHRDNILGCYTHTGVGASVDADDVVFVTQLFAVPQGSAPDCLR